MNIMDIKKEMNFMLGYKVKDVEEMINGLVYASRRKVIDREDVSKAIDNTLDLLEGLLAEGYVAE